MLLPVSAGREAGELLEIADKVRIGFESQALGDGLHRELTVVLMVVDAPASLANAVVVDHLGERLVVVLVEHL